MEASEKRVFVEMLTELFASYGKPLPEGGILKAWWSNLEQFPLRVVAAAFAAYKDENGEFAPVPAGIAKRCKLLDGRPTDDEAWAIALTSADERNTVVWTSETAEAFAACSPILDGGDEVGARMAFKDTYNRLVGAARVMNKPVEWMASLGWDAEKREEVVRKAQTAGLLPAPTVNALLPAPDTAADDAQSTSNRERVQALLAGIQDGWNKAAERRNAEIQAERDAEAQKKREIAARVAAYQSDRERT
jgi:hypothetical protein